jgi:hypothetical protein
VKALQAEPLLERRYGEYLTAYLDSSFATRNLANLIQRACERP